MKHIVLEVWTNRHGRIANVTINELDDDGAGTGYRLVGPKMGARQDIECALRYEFTERDAVEVTRLLGLVEPKTGGAA